MIICYIRSSSIGTLALCEQQYYLQYELGIHGGENAKAQKGSCTHKALECLAWKKKLEQEKLYQYDDDNFGIVTIDECEPDLLIRRSFDYYAAKYPQFKWAKGDFEDCKEWMYSILNMTNGSYDPRNLNVIQPEQSFDFTIDEPWAAYEYTLPDGKILNGQLSMKGTMDLVSSPRPGVYCVTDYKTGERMDWGTGEEKTYKKLCKDSQLQIYNYASHRLFPDAKDIILTIIYARDGKFPKGAFTVNLSKDDLPQTEEFLRSKFNEIRDCQVPELTPHPRWSGLPSKGQKLLPCNTFCYFGKNMWPGTNKNMCQFIHEEIKKNGIQDTTAKYGDLSKIQSYQSGAGRTPEDRKKKEGQE